MSLKDKIKLCFNFIIQSVIGLCFICILNADQESYISFQYTSRYYDMFPGIISSIIEQPTSLILKSTNATWNLHYFAPYKKIKAIKNIHEMGLN